MSKPSTKEAARGKWPSILRHYGLGDEYMRNVHGPCPLCGGNDRYRFDDKNGDGDYYCNNPDCGPGTGFDLLIGLRGWTFKETADNVDAVVGNLEPYKPESRPQEDPAKLKAQLNKAWSESKPNSPIVRDYLTRRGLKTFPSCLRGHPGLYYKHPSLDIGRQPAMLAMMTGADDKPKSIHRTYMLGDTLGDLKRKKMMISPDSIAGAAIRLFPAEETLGIAEGIETAIAAHELFGVPVWATYSAGNMTAVVLPATVKRVLVFADNDANGTGQQAADKARIRFLREDREAEVHVAPLLGGDWLDYLNEHNEGFVNLLPRWILPEER